MSPNIDSQPFISISKIHIFQYSTILKSSNYWGISSRRHVRFCYKFQLYSSCTLDSFMNYIKPFHAIIKHTRMLSKRINACIQALYRRQGMALNWLKLLHLCDYFNVHMATDPCTEINHGCKHCRVRDLRPLCAPTSTCESSTTWSYCVVLNITLKSRTTTKPHAWRPC